MIENNFDIVISDDDYKKAECPHLPWLTKISDHRYKCNRCETILNLKDDINLEISDHQCDMILKLKDDINLELSKKEFESPSKDEVMAFINVINILKH